MVVPQDSTKLCLFPLLKLRTIYKEIHSYSYRAEWKGSKGGRIRKLEPTQSIDLIGLGTVQSLVQDWLLKSKTLLMLVLAGGM